MLITIAVALLLVGACVLIHFELLGMVSRTIPHLAVPMRSRVLVVIGVAFLAHLLEICLFAAAYGAMHPFPRFGAIGGDFSGSVLDFFYFSITSYTTLGVGDLFPHGPLRLVAGIEALTGFVLIGWSASFTYLSMERFWGQRPKHGAPPPDRRE
jgi:hypothetical protein